MPPHDIEIAELRPAGDVFTEADLEPLAPLWHSLMDRHREIWERVPMRSHGDAWRRRKAQYLEWLGPAGSFVLVARRDGGLVAYVVVGVHEGDETYEMGERQAEIHTLAVLPGERDHGLGAELMEQAEGRLVAQGIVDVFVGTMHGNEAADRFYARHGYAPFVHMHYRRLRPDGSAASSADL